MSLRDSGVDLVAADLPEANTMTVRVMAVAAQHERELSRNEPKQPLPLAKARGGTLGRCQAGARTSSPRA